MTFRVFEEFKTVWALLGTLLAGEGAVGVTRPQRVTTAVPPFYRAWAGSAAVPTDEIVKSGPGILRSIHLFHDTFHAATAGTLDVTVYDNTAASGTVLWQGRVTSIVGAAGAPGGAGPVVIEKEFSLGVFIDYGPWVGTQPTGGNIQLAINVE